MDEIREHPQLEMGEHFHARHAHTYVATYLFIVLLLVAMAAAYTWQHKQVEQTRTRLGTLQARREQLNKQLSAITAAPQQKPVAVTPTASWKTYCDVTYGGCFRYPANWKLGTVTNVDNGKTLITTSLMNSNRSVEVGYIKPFIASKPGTLHVDNFVGLAAGNLALDVVGGYFTNSTTYDPFYAVVDTANPVFQIGKTIVNAVASQYTAKNGLTAYFSAGSTNGGFKTTTQADAWFNSSDAQTALAILRSLYYQ